jgi:hypothetical protein
MNKYEVTYRVRGYKYDCSYLVTAADAEHARKLGDEWVRHECGGHARKWKSTKQISKATA